MLEAAIAGATIALLNAVREIGENPKDWKKWQPLGFTIASGFIAVFVAWLAGSVGEDVLRNSFLTGLGASGAYTALRKIGTGQSVPEVTNPTK